jgi:precorrin-2/cobalt-factor-2 C20-methyltransferase
VLRGVDRLFAPVRRPGETSLAWGIAAHYLPADDSRLTLLEFPQPRGSWELDQQWEAHAEAVLAALHGGASAAFLTVGDPLLYSTFAHLACRLRALAPEVEVEIVPGVSSISAAAAASGEPLAVRDERLAILPAPSDPTALRAVLEQFEAVVLLKVARVLDLIVAELERQRLAEKAVLVERRGQPGERLVRGLAGFRGPVDYFSLIVVRR